MPNMTLISTVEADSVVDAWLDSVDTILDSRERSIFNLVVGIRNPVMLDDVDQLVCHEVDEFLRAHESLPLITVANTIFPGGFYRDGGAEAVYDEFPQIYTASKEKWGTYAGRLFSKTKLRDEETSKVERLVRKLRDNASKSRLRAVYEIDVFETVGPEEVSTYCGKTDAHMGIGQPCLTHLSFKLHPTTGTVSLTALYRSQFYIAKALGNFVGLAQLLAFVATESGLTPGYLVCHATKAEVDLGGWKLSEARALLKQCKQIKAAVRETSTV
jgi:thymidylate synthase